MVSISVPDTGDLVYLDFNPHSGHEQAGRCPAIVLSPRLFNEHKFAIVCPITRQEKGYPFEVKIPEGVNVEGVILTDQVRSLDWRSRGLKVVGHAPPETVNNCLDLIHTLLGK